MSCIELYRGDLCHFHLLTIENIADFVTCSSIRAVRACVCGGGGGGGGGGNGDGQIHFKIKQMGVELANVAPIVDKLFTPNFCL